MDNVAKILRLVTEGVAAVREVVAVFEATVSAAQQMNSAGHVITDADLDALRAKRIEALDRLKSRIS